MYVVFAAIATGAFSATCCQPVAVSPVNVACDSSAPAEFHRLPTCVPVLVKLLK